MPKQNDTQNTDTMLSETVAGADNFLRWSRSAMLRGGRVTKFKGIAASYSPELGLVSSGSGTVADGGRGSTTLSLARRLLRWSAAPVALLAAQSPAFAQDACVEGAPNNFICQDNGGPATVEQDLSGDGGDVVVTIEDGFAVDTSAGSGDGINISAANSVVITQSSGSSSIIGSGFGIDAYGIYNGIDITTGGDVTGLGSDGIYAGNDTSGDIAIDSRAGAVTGAGNGIYAGNNGTGSISVTTGDVTGQGSAGIYANNSGVEITIDSSAGTVTGSYNGIYTRNYGSGDTTITTGNVTGSTNNGIYARNYYGSGALTIDSTAGAVTAGENGIGVINEGIGDITITTADVDGEGGDGIDARNSGSGGDIIIDTTAGPVTGSQNGIDAINSGSGLTRITTADVTGEAGDGINARNEASATDLIIDSTAGAVTGSTNGIDVSNEGTGDTRITTADVTASNDVGIYALQSNSDLIIDSSAGAVSGGYAGIITRNTGAGSTAITTGDVTASGGNGIFSTNYGVDLGIDSSAGTVSGTANGIRARNYGTGDLSVTTAGVTGQGGNGIYATNEAAASNLTIDSSAGAVTGSQNGIRSRNNGTGDTVITTGDVSSEDAFGIVAQNGATAGNLTIDTSAGVVTALASEVYGIEATNNGTGDTTITTGEVTGNFRGISASNAATAGDLTIDSSAGAVYGFIYGVYARNNGTGDTSITTGDVDGEAGNGIYVDNERSAGNLTIDTTAGAVSGGDRGIDASQRSIGTTTITTGDVTSQNDVGFRVATATGSGTVLIDTSGGVVSGGNGGISLYTSTTSSDGATLITGDVTAATGTGIDARLRGELGTGADLTIDTTAGSVIGGGSGIIAQEQASDGGLFVTTADVDGEGGDGISALQSSGDRGMVIDTVAGEVSGSANGISAYNRSGTTSITTANVDGEGGNGIDVLSTFEAGDLIIDSSAGAVLGDEYGIFARNNGTGDTAITTGDVDGEDGNGIDVQNGARTGNLSVDSSAGTVFGRYSGIVTRNQGNGATTIVTADVETGAGEGGTLDGIYAVNYSSATDLTIDSSQGSVTGVINGISARNYGTGDASITTGNVTSIFSDGVNAYTSYRAGSLTIDTSAGAVSGGDDGIEVFHSGVGDLTITTGDVSGSAEDGIRARSYYGDININSVTGSVSGARNGIDVIHYDQSFGGYSIAITTADVTAADGDGIRVENEYGSGDISIDSSAGAVTGSNNGIYTYNRGYESPTTITTGDVTGQSGSGIVAGTYGIGAYGAGGIAIDSSAGDVTGATYGIEATNKALGDLSITTADVTGQAATGIFARNANASTGDLTIDSSAGAVSGIYGGIDAQNNGAGSTNITTGDVSSYGEAGDAVEAVNEGENLVIDTTAGRVYAYDATAIRATNNGTGITTITTGEVYSQTGGTAIRVSHSGSDVTVNTTASSVTAAGRNSDGIEVTNSGSGDTTITTGDVSGGDIGGLAPGFARGIYASNEATSGDLTIDSTSGDVAGENEGIRATNNSAGGTIIRTANVSGGSIGIVAINTNADAISGDLTIDSSAGSVTGSYRGISVDHYGTGDISVTTADVSATDGDAVNVNDNGEEGAGVDVTIDTAQGTVTGSRNGIYAANSGTGDLSITTADVTGTVGDGIEARNQDSTTGNLTIDSSAGAVSGGQSGINARNYGAGALSITTAAVTGQSGNGVDVINYIDGGELIIDTSAGAVEGAQNGIFVRHFGDDENATITTADVTGLAADGINVRDDGEAGNGADITINTTLGTVTGAEDGIDAFNFDTGDLSITTGAVSGGSGYGIYAINQGAGTGDLTIDTTAGAVTSGGRGIDARNYGSGITTITTGDVDGGGNYAIYAYSGASTTDLTINTAGGQVTGRSSGITARAYGTGNTTITTGDVSSDYGGAVVAYNSGQDITIDTTAGEVNGDGFGVYLRNDGSGDAAITTGNVTASDIDGVYAYTGFGSGSLTIDTSAGAVSGGNDGIEAFHFSYDDLSITTADASGGEDGISVLSYGDVTINSVAGTVSGDTTGIDVDIDGEGGEANVAITTADVTSSAGDGINVDTAYGSGSITIDSSAGAVTGANRGIYTNSRAYGENESITIITGDVTGQTDAGIEVRDYGIEGSGGGDITINTVAGTVSGATDGIDVENNGVGDLSITTAGVEGGDAGIVAENDSSTGDLTIDTTAGTVDATFNGIIARNEGNGSTEITTGDVFAREGSGEGPGIGILATNGSAAQDLTIDSSAGGIASNSTGIYARNSGEGALSITSGAIDSTIGNGIFTRNSGTDLTVNTTAGAVTAAGSGIRATNYGSGNTAITAADVTGISDDGINARNFATAGDLTIDTVSGAVSGGTYGINASNGGSGVLSITTANVSGAGSDGIRTRNFGTDVLIDTTAGTVSGQGNGIRAENEGTGITSVVTGDVTGLTRFGIDASDDGEGTYGSDLIVNSTVGSVTGAVGGITADNRGTGDLSITTADVTATNGDAIRAQNFGANAGAISIDTTAGVVTGSSDGIDVDNNGTGVTRITTADVTGGDDAILVRSQGTDVFVDTAAGTVSGTRGIVALLNNSTGLTSIITGDVTSVDDAAITVTTSGTDLIVDTSAGAVTNSGTGTYVSGIDAFNGGTGSTVVTTANVSSENGFGVGVSNGFDATDLTINTAAGAVSGGTDGVSATNNGTGATTITTADVTGTAGYGIYARNAGTAGDLTIDTTAGAVVAGNDGIYVQNEGTGSTTITTGDVTAGGDFGVRAYSYGIDLIIDTTAGTVTAADDDAIYARNYGTGEVAITTAALTGGDYGVYAYNSNEGTNLTIDTRAGAVFGDFEGIEGDNDGSGSLTIITADVTGAGDEGIEAFNDGADLTINTSYGSVLGEGTGVFARNRGSGALSITTADVTGEEQHGIEAENDGGTDLIINTVAGVVTGGENGILAENLGTGALSITTADVTGTGVDFNGIDARNEGTDLVIDSSAGAVTGVQNGINALNNGTGDTLITTADVTGTAGDGIFSRNAETAGDTTINTTAGAVTGGQDGIDVAHNFVGSISITTADVTGSAGNGIAASLGAEGGDLTIDTTAGAVSGGTDGISVENNGAGDTTITTANVTGADTAISANVANGDLVIDTSAGAVSGGQAGIAANNTGPGSTSIITGVVSSENGDGMNVTTDAASDSLVIETSAGAVMGGNRGIYANHAGSGDLTITVGNVTGESAEGILASTTQDSANIILTGGTGVESNVVGATTGIALSTQGADITVSGLDSVTGQAGDGLNLVSNGGDIAVTDIGTVTGLGGNGIFADADSGNITIDNVGFDGGITATGGIAIAAYADNGGSVTIGTSGVVSGETYGVDGSASGDVTIDTTNYGVTGAIGVRAVNSGAGATSVTTADVTGTGGEGITASTAGTDLLVNTVAGTITGVTDGIVASNTGTGITTVTTANVTGTTGDGIDADTAGNGLSIDSSAGAVTGGQSGISAVSYGSGTLSITTGDVTGEVRSGVYALNDAEDGDLVINTVAGDVSGGIAGIEAFQSGYGTGSLSITAANVTGGQAGINATNYGNELSIDSTAGAVVGGRDGIFASNVSSSQGNLTIVTGDVTGTSGTGIYASESGEGAGTVGADITIDSTLGTVTGGTDGIYARNIETGDLTITTAGVTGSSGQGIDAQNAAGTGDLAIDSSAGSVSGAISGILARNSGTGLTSIVTGDVTGTAGDGIAADNAGTNLAIDTSAGSVSGGIDGIDADNNGSGAASIIAGNVTGAANGISATNAAGSTDLAVNTASGTVTGATNGIDADNDGTGELILTTADIIGEAADGIAADNAGTNLAIDSSAGSVSGGANGIAAVNNGSGSLSVTAANATGTEGAGISASNAASGTDLAIDSSAGTVTGATAGIFADQLSAGGVTMLVDQVTGAVGIDSNATSGDTVITLGSTAVVTGTSGFGIDARSTGGNVTVQGSSGSVIGATDGIYVRPTTGDITISTIDLVEGQAGDGLDLLTQGGNITVTDIGAIIGTGGNGVAANANGGVVDVQTAGDITGSIAGVAATTTDAGTINLSVGGTTSGTQNGLDVATGGGAVTINNSGNLSGGDFAVLASGPETGSITLDNSGTLSSAIQFAAADDSFTNSGTFAAAGTSDFGDGDDTLVNTGIIAATGAVQFDRLETLQSGGTLSLADGAATGTFTTSGDFVGTGGDIVLDVDFATSTSDQLIIGGAATGTTTIALNAISSGFSFNQDFVVVQAGAGTEATAFVLGDGQQITPFLNADLSFDAAANTFSFEVILSERVFEGTKIAENAQALWYRSADAWADQRANSRANESAGEGTPVWVVAYGASANRDETFRDRAGLGLNDAALDYSQDFFGLQGGADYALGDAFTLGVTGGFLSSTARQDENGNRINFDTLNIGLSASYAAGSFFADALVKFDSISGDLSDPTGAGFNGTLDGQAFGLRAQAGYRFGDDSFYVEPNAAFDLQKTNLDDLVIEAQTFVFDNVNGARGTAGIRFGGESKTASGANIGYYLGTNLVHEFDGKADVRFLINDGEIGFQNNPIDTYGNLEAGISVDNGGPLSGFLQVESDLSKDYQSFGGKVAVKLKF
ncbi:hypothetical protein ACRAQ7_07125 [Erythrobacter sp. W53]|uniref:hypothetical protein n=1 Tax=Erythrobacter sp. W53 TaxID=3425947 RepID=UPI003D768CE4